MTPKTRRAVAIKAPKALGAPASIPILGTAADIMAQQPGGYYEQERRVSRHRAAHPDVWIAFYDASRKEAEELYRLNAVGYQPLDDVQEKAYASGGLEALQGFYARAVAARKLAWRKLSFSLTAWDGKL